MYQIDRQLQEYESFLSNKFLCFDDVYKYFTLIRFYKYFVLEHDYHFKNKFLQYSITHQYRTRGRENININVPFVRVSRMYNSFLYNSLILWNQLPTFLIKGPIHDSDFQPQPQFPTATSTKFPVYGLQQPQPPPQLAGRGGGCC